MSSFGDEEVFFTHHNEERPLCVIVDAKHGVRMFKKQDPREESKTSPASSSPECIKRTIPGIPSCEEESTGYYSAEPDMSWPAESVSTIYIGTRLGNDEGKGYDFWINYSRGSYMLLELKTGSYVLLGGDATIFDAPEPVTGVSSYIGGNGAVYGVVFTEKFATTFEKIEGESANWSLRSGIDEKSKYFIDWWLAIEEPDAVVSVVDHLSTLGPVVGLKLMGARVPLSST